MNEDEIVDQANETEAEQQAEELDEYGNPEGTEYDEDGNPIEAQSTETPEEPAAEEPEPEEEPSSVYLPTGEGPAQSRLKELLADPDVYAALDAAMEEKVQRRMQGMMVGQASLSAVAAQHPELWRTHGRKISAALAMLPQDVQHTQKGIDTALIFALEDKLGTPQFASSLMKLAQTLNGEKPAAPKPPKAPIPPGQRAPSPSVSTQRTAPQSGRERRISAIMADVDGLTREEAEDAAAILNQKGAGRR